MTKIYNAVKYRYLAMVLSIVLITGGIVATVLRGGFNLGIDFQGGLSQRIQIVRPGFSISYLGTDTVSLDIGGGSLSIEVRGEEGVETFIYPFAQYPTIGEVVEGLSKVPGVTAVLQAEASAPSAGMITGMSLPAELGVQPDLVHLLEDRANPVSIEEVRRALASLESVQIQTAGRQTNQEFLIRVKDESRTMQSRAADEILALLEAAFGDGCVIVKQSDYVGPKVSGDTVSQTVYLTVLAIALILVYIWIRFKLAYAVAAIIALVHDAAFMLAVIGAFQMEVSTATIAAILTIIGYSINDTIVIFDRIRENVNLMRESDLKTIVNTSISQSLSRTIMTSLTTLLAIVAIVVFGTGMIREFAVNLIVGILIGTYSSNFIASPIFLAWTNALRKRRKLKDERLYGTQVGKKGEQKAERKVDAEALQVAEGNETEAVRDREMVKPIEIPTAQRKLKGKRQQKKRH
jgi:preprotein translocase subunit SecF